MTAGYIAHHRKRLVRNSGTIQAETQAQLGGFFPDSVLAETRVIRAVMPEPMLYPLVKVFGIQGLLEMSSIGAITLVDVVAYPGRLDCSTLFHELVHVVQYRVLGLKRFAELYVRGFLERGGYRGIPLERQAYELGARFDREPKKIFSVEEDVIRRSAAGLL
ncbi:MAG: hypothetical protein ACXVBY_18460 [Isosphaeraceae bacterium]